MAESHEIPSGSLHAHLLFVQKPVVAQSMSLKQMLQLPLLHEAHEPEQSETNSEQSCPLQRHAVPVLFEH